mmetsp:Transcript_24559/g.73623  ORF Transcript_24559/g.73623 Transcript_24559/m.73623 type:complete len:1294 (+) Transcript_24559:488-4369(+)|eukprot:CAMPEP_0206293274 /NCGR_PEP_ID=MMETSP0106_2-20121207/4054_1 /ASSEMBLY_ACC=CAM_ASM_000206 /TAXON_ID=81532 /ORGANISM="Acanthoeca-like sp., Strain 10tr" /LENGTH=1293 /DNA_ID=CAMNT_0053723867 /DNA_START=482 /DNA_END=4363 /DNA_ORIENTATION=-
MTCDHSHHDNQSAPSQTSRRVIMAEGHSHFATRQIVAVATLLGLAAMCSANATAARRSVLREETVNPLDSSNPNLRQRVRASAWGNATDQQRSNGSDSRTSLTFKRPDTVTVTATPQGRSRLTGQSPVPQQLTVDQVQQSSTLRDTMDQGPPVRVDPRPQLVTESQTCKNSPREAATVDRCKADVNCTICAHGLARATNVPTVMAFLRQSQVELRETQGRFIDALFSIPECAEHETIPLLYDMFPAVGALDPCAGSMGLVLDTCAQRMLVCLDLPETCMPCVDTLRHPEGRSISGVFRSPVCAAAGNLSSDGGRTLFDIASTCQAFPQCSAAKFYCDTAPDGNSGCAQCHASLQRGDVSAAISDCPIESLHGSYLDGVVEQCLEGSELGCDYFWQRCMANDGCGACVSACNNLSSSHDIAVGMGTPECELYPVARNLLSAVNTFCLPTRLDSCQAAVTTCVLHDPRCGQCILNASNSTAPCDTWLSSQRDGFGVYAACASCSPSAKNINWVVLTTSVCGAISVLVVALVMAMIFRRICGSIRERLMFGLFFYNLVYSAANVVPLNQVHDSDARCGQLKLTFEAIRWGRTVWMAGKFGLVGYEIVILGASVAYLVIGANAVGRRAEVALHLFPVVMALTAAVIFYVECDQANLHGYNARDQDFLSRVVTNVNADDDGNDDGGVALMDAIDSFKAQRAAYDSLMQDMLVAWNGFLVIVVIMWFSLRGAYRCALGRWFQYHDEWRREHFGSPWILNQRSMWRAGRDVFLARRQGYEDVAGPMEPFIWVFGLFGPPAVLMATPYCMRHASVQTSSDTGVGTNRAVYVDFGSCDVYCECALAFRSLATAAVYLWQRYRYYMNPSLNRDVGTDDIPLLRIGGEQPAPAAPTPHPADQPVAGAAAAQPAVIAAAAAPAAGAAGAHPAVAAPAASDRPKKILECFLTPCDDDDDYEELGEGTYGTVFKARMHLPTKDPIDVAVKVLDPVLHDDDGDAKNPLAKQDFLKEVQTLHRLYHQNVVMFHGYGYFCDDRPFLVMELMESSLFDLITTFEPGHWLERMSIALQIASGVQYLHTHDPPLVHRDIKSSNVLLGLGAPRVVLSDLGHCRAVEAKTATVKDNFTGVTHTYMGDAVKVVSPLGKGPKAVRKLKTGPMMNVKGVMSTWRGTLWWMAPEVLQGQAFYDTRADIYSLGVVFWELATWSSPPWQQLVDSTVWEQTRELERLLQKGERPHVPLIVADEDPAFIGLMKRCWASDVTARPNIRCICEEIDACRDAAMLLADDGHAPTANPDAPRVAMSF